MYKLNCQCGFTIVFKIGGVFLVLYGLFFLPLEEVHCTLTHSLEARLPTFYILAAKIVSENAHSTKSSEYNVLQSYDSDIRKKLHLVVHTE